MTRRLCRLELVVLLDQRAGPLFEGLAILLGPPVPQRPVAVAGRALIIEAVGDLMPDHRADPAVVHRVIGVGVEERRQNDPGREIDAFFSGMLVALTVCGVMPHPRF